ncbi:MAG: redoxin domain-containing protein [Acidimicrobiia bacterium]|jgi:hypothetical protein|nr:redoxin domain-containing protein [Acidimicrobiia bacterium]
MHPTDPGSGLPEVDFSVVGPRIGERFPDLELPNQSGEMIDLHEYRAGRSAMINFHRSADW